MEQALERSLRDVLAAEQFGVLATAADGRLHTSTVLFAETEAWELVHVLRTATLKARLSAESPEVAFQVDNRAVVAEDRTRFTRLGFEGVLRRVRRDQPEWQQYHDVLAAKIAAGALLLQNSEVELYVLTPWTVRAGIGAQPAEDIPIPLPPVPSAPAPDPTREHPATRR